MRRRELRARSGSSPLPSAPPVLTAQAARGRRAPVLLALGLAAVGIACIGAGALTIGGMTAEDDDVAGVTYTPSVNAESDAPEVHPGTCLAFVPTGGDTRADVCRSTSAPAQNTQDEDPPTGGEPEHPSTPGSTPKTTESDDAVSRPDATDRDPGTASEAAAPSQSGSSQPSSPAPSAPSSSTPSSPPSSSPPPAQAPRASLAFTDISTKTTVNLLGIRVLSGYTLSLSGEPGQTANVWYGSARAGTVTFDASGRAALTVGRSLIDLGLGDPLIRAEYDDGTGAIQARRSAI